MLSCILRNYTVNVKDEKNKDQDHQHGLQNLLFNCEFIAIFNLKLQKNKAFSNDFIIRGKK